MSARHCVSLRQNALDRRSSIRDRLLAATGLQVETQQRNALASTDHPLDALVASFVGRACAMGQTTHPTDEDLSVARREGWIHLPTISLDALPQTRLVIGVN